MFQSLHKKTVDILAAKAANYPFENTVGEGGEELAQEAIMDNKEMFEVLKAIYNQERELDELDGDERIVTLNKCRDKIRSIREQREKCDKTLTELREKYSSVADKTSSLHNACDQMMSQQTQLAAANEQIKANIHYYLQYDWLVKKLQTSKLSLTGTLFTQILSNIHECITYLKANKNQKEAEIYLQKYEQCLSRSLTAIKMGVLADLEQCKEDVFYRQSRAAQTASAANADGHKQTVLSYVDDDTFTLLYGVFGVKANAIRNAFSQAHQFFADSPEYQTVVAECEQDYFHMRDGLLRPIVQATIQSLCKRHANSSCTLTRDGCTFLLRLCDDEFRLYKQFFVVGSDGTGTRSVRTPSVASSLPGGSLLHSFWHSATDSSTNTFDVFIEGLCRILYDTLRPLIIHNPHLETLAQLCTLLKVEMIEERCGALFQPPQFAAASFRSESGDSSAAATTGPTAMTNPRTGFAHVMSELVADIVERIVYRTSLFAQTDVLGYNPAPGDLVYPERLIMMRNIKEQDQALGSSQVQQSRAQSTDGGEEHELETSDLVESKMVRKSSIASSIGTPSANKSSTSPIDQHCLWYPTVRRTVMCLSKLYKCLDQTVFLNVSRELLDACCQSLELAVERIRGLPVDPAKATIRGSGAGASGRWLDAELFIVKHLLILREQTSPYRQPKQHQGNGPRSVSFSRTGSTDSAIAPQLDYSLDLGKYTQSMLQLLSAENRTRWFEFGSNNALLSLLLLTPIHVSELQTDSRRIIETHLKKWCQTLISHVTGFLVANLAGIAAEVEQFQALKDEQMGKGQREVPSLDTNEKLGPKALNDRTSIAFKNVKQQWPAIRSAFSLYVGVRETEEILLQPIRKAVVSVFNALNAFSEKNFSDEQRQVASVPNQEQIWLILNA